MTAVLTAIGHRWEAQIAGLVEGSGDLRLERRCADLAELLSCAEAGLGQVAIVSADLRGLNLTAVDRLHACSLAVVGVAPGDDEGAERILHQLGIVRVLPVEISTTDLTAAIAAVVADAQAGPASSDPLRPLATSPGVAPIGAGAPLGGPNPAGEESWTPAPPAPSAGRFAGPGSEAEPVTAERPTNGAQNADQNADQGDDQGAQGGTFDDNFVGQSAQSPLDPNVLEPRAPGVVIAVWGPIGAPGRTSLAVNLATEFARAGHRALVIDADTYGASIAQALALLDEAPGIAAAARLAELGTLDLAALARVAPEVEPRLRVLTGLPRADRWPEVRAGAAERILHLGRNLADLVVVDIGFNLEQDEELSYDTLAPRRNAVARAAIESADTVIAIGSGDPVGLARLVRGLAELREIGVDTPRVVVNRVRSAAVGSGPQRRIGDSLERFAGVGEAHFVVDDPAGFDAAVLTGRALADAAPKSPARSAILKLAQVLAADLIAIPAPTGAATSRSAGRTARRGPARRVTR